MERLVWLTVDETRCAFCGTKTKYEDWHCPNPDCNTDFHTGIRWGKVNYP